MLLKWKNSKNIFEINTKMQLVTITFSSLNIFFVIT